MIGVDNRKTNKAGRGCIFEIHMAPCAANGHGLRPLKARLSIFFIAAVTSFFIFAGAVQAQEPSHSGSRGTSALERMLENESDAYRKANDSQRVALIHDLAVKRGGYDQQLLEIVTGIALRGTADAFYVTGMVYTYPSWRSDPKILQDEEKGAFGFRMAAERGHLRAAQEAGECFYRGKGVGEDWGEALYWFEKAGRSNEPEFAYSQYAAAVILMDRADDTNNKEDEEKAIEWLRKAAANGDEASRNWLKELEAEKGRAPHEDKKSGEKHEWSFPLIETR